RLVVAGDDMQLAPIVAGKYPDTPPGDPVLHRSIFELVRSRAPGPEHPDSPVRQLLENFRMNDVLTSYAAGLIYGPGYRCFDTAVACRRLRLADPSLTGKASSFVGACLDPAYALVLVILDGVTAARE